MGISASRILLVTMGLSVALAAVAGILLAPLDGVRPDMWGAPLVTVMVIVTLGGLGSIKGSIIGAFIIALVEQLASFLIPTGGYLTGTIILLAMVIVLIVRPAGLFGTMFEEEKL
jgi:branched-chain amino acid transport system permease protein